MPVASRPTTCTQTCSPAATRYRYRGVRHDRSGASASAVSRSYRLLLPLPWKIQSVMTRNGTGIRAAADHPADPGQHRPQITVVKQESDDPERNDGAVGRGQR